MDMEWAKDGITNELFICASSSRNSAEPERCKQDRRIYPKGKRRTACAKEQV